MNRRGEMGWSETNEAVKKYLRLIEGIGIQKTRPDMYISLFSSDTPQPTLFQFSNDVLSKPLEFNIYLHNKGSKISCRLYQLLK